MIDIRESWDSIAGRIGNRSFRRGRGLCPFCGSRTGFSVHEEKGFHCFACGVHGDKISFIRQFCKCNFKEALCFFGLKPGRPPAPDPAVLRRRRIRKGLRLWAHTLQRGLRDEFYFRSRIEHFGKRRLEDDPEDRIGWELLSIAYRGVPLDELERRLDLLIGAEEQQIEAYRLLRKTA